MTHEVRFHPWAQQDLAELVADLTHAAGPDTARRFVERIVDYCLGFETFPERGTRHDEISPGLRTVGWRRRATVAFLVEGKRVIVLRVLYAGRALELPPDD